MQLQVIVNKLNKRKSPVTNFADNSNVTGVVSKGFTFESDGEITNVLGTWVRDRDGSYYWTGGLHKVSSATLKNFVSGGFLFPATEPNSKWLNALHIGSVWGTTKGASVNVAVLDSGINLENPELITSLFSNDTALCCRNFLDGSSDVSDQFGHGSHCASIISSRNAKLAVGVAPEAKLFIGKISAFGEMRGYEMLTKAILWASDIPEVDIISISFGLNGQHPSFQDFSKAVEHAFAKKKIIVAAIGDKELNPNPVYPALFLKCISVGACDPDFIEWDGNAVSEQTFLYAPGTDITSYVVKNDFFPDDPFPMSGSSQATAVVSGIVALLISFLKKNKRPFDLATIRKILKDNAKPLASDKLKSAIDPIHIFSSL